MVNYQISHGSGRMIYEEELRPPIRDFYSKQFNQIASEKGIEIESERLNPIRDRMVDEVIERIRKAFDKAWIDPFSFKVDDSKSDRRPMEPMVRRITYQNAH
jgi:hypothetical protein